MGDDSEAKFDGLLLSIAQQHGGINEVTHFASRHLVLISLFVAAGHFLWLSQKKNRFLHWCTGRQGRGGRKSGGVCTLMVAAFIVGYNKCSQSTARES